MARDCHALGSCDRFWHKPASAKRSESNKPIKKQGFRKARENARAQAAIGFRFTRHLVQPYGVKKIAELCTLGLKHQTRHSDSTSCTNYF